MEAEEKINELEEYFEHRDELLKVSAMILAGMFANNKIGVLTVNDVVDTSLVVAKCLIEKVDESL